MATTSTHYRTMPEGRRSTGWRALWLLALLFTVSTASTAFAASDDFEQGLALLSEKSFSKKGRAIELLVASGHEQVLPLLQTMSAGELYYRKSDDRIVTRRDADTGYEITDAVSGEALGTVGRRDVKKVAINNTLRSQLTQAIAELQLGAADPGIRKTALEAMLSELTADSLPLLEKRRRTEQDDSVIEVLDIAIAVAQLESSERSVRLQALQALEGSLYPSVRNRLVTMTANDADAGVRKAAEKALITIESRVNLFSNLETLFFGVSLGSVLILAAIGLAITFGVMGVINMAHGELIMIGAYTTYVIQLLMPNAIEYSLLVAVPAAFIVSGLVGIAIERGVIRFLYGRPLETLLATFGLSLVLQQAVRSIFSPLNRSVETPQWMSGTWEINAIFSLTLNRLYIIAFCLIVFFLLHLILKRTRLGLEVRAVSQNRQMARAMGVRSQWVDALTFGLGSGIAGVAGVALSQLTNVGPNLGQAYIIDSFMVVVFGGVGNLWGTLVAGLSLGVANKVMEPWAGAVLAKILVLVFIILFIQKRPRGLFPQKGRAAEG
ncbi:urea ABC transporter permease subunit UrtB [Motiliproteus sediminis]|uniref:urea ABC transporter permease subunit UrtB n=1 Tax=Motiliproteus sediminis TaxID=1468178 RepID=UPI001FE454C1|nr:urea ABC transporter permease subunit UrtB [Motiliproteus sediminis]